MLPDSGDSSKFCPKCGGALTTEAVFCHHCAFKLPDETTAETPGTPARKLPVLLIGVVGIVIVLTLAGFLVYKYRSRTVASSSNNVMSQRAMNIEERIIRGETLSEADISGLTSYELRVLRNAHFARYGRGYDSPGLGDYFRTRPWYRPDPSYQDSMINATDKANINLILVEETRAKANEAALNITPGIVTSILNDNSLTADKVQRAVDKVLSFTKIGGAVAVQGIQEMPQQNAAKADLIFNNFQYKAREMGEIVSKDAKLPNQPNINSPNYYGEALQYSVNPVKLRNFSGPGKAILEKYNDGRWVLKIITFGGSALGANIIIE